MPDPAPARKPSRYQRLADWLTGQPHEGVTLTFAQVQTILGAPLPLSAEVDSSWWTTRHPRGVSHH
jgi:hypothetical protein